MNIRWTHEPSRTLLILFFNLLMLSVGRVKQDFYADFSLDSLYNLYEERLCNKPREHLRRKLIESSPNLLMIKNNLANYVAWK